MIKWYPRLSRTHALTALSLLVGTAVAISVAARVTLARRGTRVPIILYRAASGNHAEALRAYERCRKRLADELEAEPALATQEV